MQPPRPALGTRGDTVAEQLLVAWRLWHEGGLCCESTVPTPTPACALCPAPHAEISTCGPFPLSETPVSEHFSCTASDPDPGGIRDEDVFNLELRKFFKRFGVMAQREIEKVVETALRERKLAGNDCYFRV
jgi:hypothetical protein